MSNPVPPPPPTPRSVLPPPVHAAMGPLLAAAYVLLVLSPVLISWWFVPVDEEEVLWRLAGKQAGLLGMAVLLVQPLLAARLRWMERPFGQDRLLRFHRLMGAAALALLVVHPVLLAAGSRWSLLYSLSVPWPILLGKAALVLLAMLVAAAWAFGRLPLTYERWRTGHGVAAVLVLVLGAGHAFIVGDDVGAAPLHTLVPAALAAVLAVVLYHRVIRPRALARAPWTVTAVDREAEGVWNLRLEPPAGRAPFAHDPGQFHYLTYAPGPARPREEHHFTISSSPAQRGLRASTIKASGDFTAMVGDVRPGDKVAVHGPFGRFSHVRHQGEHGLVFVVGGIGITPAMSMLRFMRDTGDDRPALLIYASRSEEDIVFQGDLADMADGRSPRLRVVHVLSEPGPYWQGATGRVDKELVERHLDHLEAAPESLGWYLCGPGDMVAGLRKILADMGVPGWHIHWEIFAFLGRNTSLDPPGLRLAALATTGLAVAVGIWATFARLP